jgi:hypothetical protein
LLIVEMGFGSLSTLETSKSNQNRFRPKQEKDAETMVRTAFSRRMNGSIEPHCIGCTGLVVEYRIDAQWRRENVNIEPGQRKGRRDDDSKRIRDSRDGWIMDRIDRTPMHIVLNSLLSCSSGTALVLIFNGHGVDSIIATRIGSQSLSVSF